MTAFATPALRRVAAAALVLMTAQTAGATHALAVDRPNQPARGAACVMDNPPGEASAPARQNADRPARKDGFPPPGFGWG
jgi:hypothetical protein